jgi:hypothetical protein
MKAVPRLEICPTKARAISALDIAPINKLVRVCRRWFPEPAAPDGNARSEDNT